jgi:hypothetical protein
LGPETGEPQHASSARSFIAASKGLPHQSPIDI